jgi:hypothetical protein
MARDLRPSQRPLFELGGKWKGGGAVDVWVDRPERVYSVGQRLEVFVRSKEAAYITVLNVGSSGNVAVIFPNHYQRDMRVRAGETVRIPAAGSNWHIDVAGPPGIELVMIVASREPLRLPELERLAAASEDRPLVSLGRTGEEVARDLVPQSNSIVIPGGVKILPVRVVQRRSRLEHGAPHEGLGAGLRIARASGAFLIAD